MFLALLARPTKVVTISNAATNVNLYTQAGSPTYPLNLLCFINNTVTSNSPSTPAFDVGSGWKAGSLVYIDNNNTITGRIGNTGNPGNAGTTGAAGNTGTTGSPGTAGKQITGHCSISTCG